MEFGKMADIPSRIQCYDSACHVIATLPCWLLGAREANTLYSWLWCACLFWVSLALVKMAMSVLRACMNLSASIRHIPLAETTLYIVIVMCVWGTVANVVLPSVCTVVVGAVASVITSAIGGGTGRGWIGVTVILSEGSETGRNVCTALVSGWTWGISLGMPTVVAWPHVGLQMGANCEGRCAVVARRYCH